MGIFNRILLGTILILMLHYERLSGGAVEAAVDVQSSCMVATSSPLTIRVSMVISIVSGTNTAARSADVTCTDNLTDQLIPVLSRDILSAGLGSGSYTKLSVTVKPLSVLPDSIFTCVVTGSNDECITTASCTLKDYGVSPPLNVRAKRVSAASTTLHWDRVLDTYSISHYEAIVQAMDGNPGESHRAFTKGRDSTEVTVEGLTDAVSYTAKVYAVGVDSGATVILPGQDSTSISIPSLCQPALGQVIHVTLSPTVIEDAEDIIETDDLCSVVDFQNGFMREAVDLLFIETESIPDECRETPPKILSYSCGDDPSNSESTKKTRRKSKSKRKGFKAGRSASEGEIESTESSCEQGREFDITDATKRSKKKLKKGSRGGTKQGDWFNVVSDELIPEELIIKRMAFRADVHQTNRKESRYCGAKELNHKNRYQACECPKECSESSHG